MKRRKYEDNSIDEGPRPDIKALRLCGQVARAISLALAGEFDDEVLLSLTVVSVDPAPNASRLLVTVTAESGDPDLILARLNGVRGILRAGVAATVCRKRAPELSFLVLR